MAELELPAASVALVRKHARVVVGRAGLGASERADVEQELTARLLGGWPQYGRPAGTRWCSARSSSGGRRR
ncbi:hypothetical protein [Fimbriiglobus ruber]|uniref:Uncharacterized protein n=1 Tax=Fimbriiglobus ruber TaxID=1908690 RepID=A0A225DQQ7_9BACT|nr:hypothetical protein [Fimbriiglobus ruber]OWK39876.1 hypothetical protein FRUB_05766 [Fimbriiglobus ruber]